jgi:hypothetical protein
MPKKASGGNPMTPSASARIQSTQASPPSCLTLLLRIQPRSVTIVLHLFLSIDRREPVTTPAKAASPLVPNPLQLRTRMPEQVSLSVVQPQKLLLPVPVPPSPPVVARLRRSKDLVVAVGVMVVGAHVIVIIVSIVALSSSPRV